MGSLQDLEIGLCDLDPRHGQFLFEIDSHRYRIHWSLTADLCFDGGYVGKQPEIENCAEYYWLKETRRKH